MGGQTLLQKDAYPETKFFDHGEAVGLLSADCLGVVNPSDLSGILGALAGCLLAASDPKKLADRGHAVQQFVKIASNAVQDDRCAADVFVFLRAVRNHIPPDARKEIRKAAKKMQNIRVKPHRPFKMVGPSFG